MTNQTTMITYKTPDTFDTYYCTEDTKLVTMFKDVVIKILPLGRFIVPIGIFRDFDLIAVINTGVYHYSIDNIIQDKISLKTSDGIALCGSLSYELQVSSKEEHLKFFALKREDCFKMFKTRLVWALQASLSQHSLNDLPDFINNGSKEIISSYAGASADNSCPFLLKKIHLNGLEVLDKDLRDSRLEAKKSEQEADVISYKSDLSRKQMEKEEARKLIEIKNQMEIDKIKRIHEMELSAREKELELQLRAKKAEILKTEEGQMTEDMETVFNYKEKKLEVERLVAQLGDNQSREILKAVLSHQSGENRVLMALAANQIGIKLTDGRSVIDVLDSTKTSPESENKELPVKSDSNPPAKPDAKKTKTWDHPEGRKWEKMTSQKADPPQSTKPVERRW